MKQTVFSLLAFAGLAMLGLAGCSDSALEPSSSIAPPGVTNESEALQYYARMDEFVTNENQTFSDESLEATDYGTFGRVGQSVIPVMWGRFVDNVSVTSAPNFEAGDSIANVLVEKEINGTLRILAKYGENDTTMHLIEKPFTDHSARNIVFRRVGRETDRFWLNWIPVATSLVSGETAKPPAGLDITIMQLEFEKPNGEIITITDPLAFYLRYAWRNMRLMRARWDVPELSMGESFRVRATVVSASADTDLVVLRYGFSPVARRRMLMDLVSETPNEDGTFTRVFEQVAAINHHPGSFHAGVVAMARKTLYDDDPANYSVSWWGVPYRVK